jgi:hypothetical protein
MAECPDAFVQDLMALLNRYSMEQASETPDFMLAEYLMRCLETWNATTAHREQWYGRVGRPLAELREGPRSMPQPTAQEGA